ncbi:hypothetical protein [Alteromonas halophila]|uniref:Uncharacterized protein n=1 Tax=Alteromonas halophila TaxID=516698 RepID=A0A918JFD6_9ALTE|nr:hypothetical protein [Alteromonas halophila]GGW75062.1 hypothetical protein GCM10007391_04070 [Alteromonas halophila]
MGNKNTISTQSDRRQLPRRQDMVYRGVITLNVIAWLMLVVALILFHFARPDFVSGVQQYWGIEGDTAWSQGYLTALQGTLLVCVGLTLLSMILRRHRTRRQADRFGANLFILALLAAISLIMINTISP